MVRDAVELTPGPLPPHNEDMSTPNSTRLPITTRRRLMLLAPAGVLAAGLVGVAAWSQLRPDPSAPVASIGGPFVLQDGNGHTITDRDFRGRWMLIYFGYTHCPDACPTALQDMATALDDLGDKRRDVAPIFITVDPERDTPAVMKDYVANFGSGITGLSGTPDAIAQAAREYRVYYAKHPTADGYDMDHSSIIYLMDPQGRFIANFTHETPPEGIAARLRALV